MRPIEERVAVPSVLVAPSNPSSWWQGPLQTSELFIPSSIIGSGGTETAARGARVVGPPDADWLASVGNAK